MMTAAAANVFIPTTLRRNSHPTSTMVTISALRMTDGLNPVTKAYVHRAIRVIVVSMACHTRCSHKGFASPPSVSNHTISPHTMPVCSPLTAKICMAPAAEKDCCTCLSNSSLYPNVSADSIPNSGSRTPNCSYRWCNPRWCFSAVARSPRSGS